ncbi:MAG: DNA polymerase Y family protein, partial [Acidimicrobiales bacterium]
MASPVAQNDEDAPRTPERMLVVWCPDWPVVSAGLPADSPAAVVEANQVVACSAAARAESVQRGLRRRQAEARCPGLVVIRPDPGREARAFEPVVAAVETFTPRVEVVRPGMCAFATRGPSRYFGGDGALAALVAERVDAVVAARCRVGIADGHFAAERAARRSEIVPPGQARAFLAPFPLSALNQPELADLLVRLGIRTLGELAALPSRAVLARFGPDGAGAHRLARGLDHRPLAARTPPPDLTVTAELDPPADRVETATFVARSLAARLHESLSDQGLVLVLVRVEAETEHGEFLSRSWRIEGGTAVALAERVRWQLDGWLAGAARPRRLVSFAFDPSGRGGRPTSDRHLCDAEPPPAGRSSAEGELRHQPPTGPLTLLRLVPEEVRPDGGRQDGFWGGDRAAAERAARALERVQGRLGAASVVTASVVGGRSPAEQVALV